ncbi:MAG: hypothetical protein JW712_08910 [Dehalococcoidales bacterium]|nr:hypothetical protein [Dehalococcoidales bacterium]
MPYLAKLEKAGIPTVLIDFEDQHEMVKQEALAAGVPKLRYLPASRVLPGPEDVQQWIEPMMNELLRPLTDEEKAVGKHTPYTDRILFTGTLFEAEEFYNQTQFVPEPLNAPINVYTDGLPVVLPTEERVAAMLKGTSHKPDELIRYQSERRAFGGNFKKGDVVRFQPRNWTATVEQVAANAVMAGCKPEYLPAVLAIAESGVPSGTTVFNNQFICISGPYAKEIGMNAGMGLMGPGNQANSAIGRAYQLMALNLGGSIPGVNRLSSLGAPINRCGLAFAECTDKLPPGWKGLNEQYDYKPDESVAWVMIAEGGVTGAQFSPGGYRALQKSGHGGMARKLGVKGVPGPHNWLDWILPDIWKGEREGPRTWVMTHEMAQHLWDIGFKTKEDVLEYIWKKSFEPLKDFRNRSWVDLTTNGWLGIEPISGKPWKELPDDYLVPVGGDSPDESTIIVCGSDEEICYQFPGSFRGIWASNPIYSIEAWK